MFGMMNVAEKNAFLRANGLLEQASNGVNSAEASNHLILSPVQDVSVKNRNRAAEALRLTTNDVALAVRDVNEKTVRMTDADMKLWFERIDTNGNGYISQMEFLAFYQNLEWYGGPTKLPWVNQQLSILCADGQGVNLEKFAYLVSHMSGM
jgi:hypothetical protein